MKWYLVLYQTFHFCLRCRWKDAQRSVDTLRKGLESEAFEVSEELERWVVYLQALIEQGTGNLEAARRIFRSPILHDARKMAGANKRLGQVRDDLWTLSRLHLFLMDDGEEDDEAAADAVVALLRASVPDRHPNDHLRCALALASATKTATPAKAAAAAARRRSDGPGAAASASTITRQKAELQKALELARTLGNAQLLAMSMTAFVGIFFAHITVGEQARKEPQHGAHAGGQGRGSPVGGGRGRDAAAGGGGGAQGGVRAGAAVDGAVAGGGGQRAVCG